MGDEHDPRRLSGLGQGWRLGVVVLAFAGLAYGSTVGGDEAFPFGPLSQYAGRIDSTGGEVVSTYVQADLTTGKSVDVRLKQVEVGLGRADIEGRIGDIVARPSMLQALARAHRELRPRDPRFTTLYLKQDTQQLHEGRATGPKTTKTLATWVVR